MAFAPAKINWTLEVMGKRDDGYHEIASVMQTISLADVVTVREAPEPALRITGHAAWMGGLAAEDNLAYRALLALSSALGLPPNAAIVIDKSIPVAAGLGGGASDAAAVLRALPLLWQRTIEESEIMRLASEIGSDVPFFMRCGSAMVSGRGELVQPLRDASLKHLVVLPRSGESEKTGVMYARLDPGDFSDGSLSAALARRFEHRLAYDGHDCCNAFTRAAGEGDPGVGSALRAIMERVGTHGHLAGAGPSVFAAFDDEHEAGAAARELERSGLRAVACRTMTAAEALRLEVGLGD
ncbi:MAG: 4-(cytidine 5'-diphospho)-2-C-methyl-D-erythritol kinase [Dehalococcoidia bacterium]|nr:4-(cytidine 5'-diphospho)-2-C-methyl-D-erythritol kinase [Dehalococcoidia bacterium]